MPFGLKRRTQRHNRLRNRFHNRLTWCCNQHNRLQSRGHNRHNQCNRLQIAGRNHSRNRLRSICNRLQPAHNRTATAG